MLRIAWNWRGARVRVVLAAIAVAIVSNERALGMRTVSCADQETAVHRKNGSGHVGPGSTREISAGGPHFLGLTGASDHRQRGNLGSPFLGRKKFVQHPRK
jgi:hypothetical protein